MTNVDWFWVIWYSLLGLVVVLVWYVEFSGLLDLKKKSKKKTMWQESKDRIHQQSYRNTYGSYSSRRNYRKGMQMNRNKLLANRIKELKDKEKRESVFSLLDEKTQDVIKDLINNMMVKKYEK